jgi:Multicopper oxidase
MATVVTVPPDIARETASGTPGPGPYAGGSVDFTRTGVKGPVTFGTFGCDVFNRNPKTPDWRTADVHFQRTMIGDGRLTMPDGRRVRYWTFADTLKAPGSKPFPSAPIRVTEGQLVHVKLVSNKSSHTIHHHGIEPTTMNDGVGHVSFEVTDTYIYQWQPHQAGLYFYHCHKNTVLHFEMGLVGPLIVDPPAVAGRVPAFKDGPFYDVEVLWVADDIDPVWHELDDEAGMCGDDAGLNNFNPKYFLINGVPNNQTKTSPKVAVKAVRGQKILIRMLNSSYSLLRTTFQGLNATLISVDGHPLGTAKRPWNRPVLFPANQAFIMPTAARHEFLIDTAGIAPGTYRVGMEFLHWAKRARHNLGDRRYEGYAETLITIT